MQDGSEYNSLNHDPGGNYGNFLDSFVLAGAESTTGALGRPDVSCLFWYLILLQVVPEHGV